MPISRAEFEAAADETQGKLLSFLKDNAHLAFTLGELTDAFYSKPKGAARFELSLIHLSILVGLVERGQVQLRQMPSGQTYYTAVQRKGE